MNESVSPTPHPTAPRPVIVRPAPPPKRTYTASESVYAWFCLLAGYLFCRVFPVNLSPLLGFVFVVLLFGVTTAVLLVKKQRIGALAWAAAVSAVVMNGSLVLSDEALFHHLSYLYALVAFTYFVYAATGNALQGGLSNLLPMDLIRAIFLVPFCANGFLFAAVFSGKAQKSGKIIVKLLIGILLAIVPTAIVLLLLSYDSDFVQLLRSLFDFDVWSVFSRIVSLVFGVPIGMYLFAMLIANTDGRGEKLLTQEHCCVAVRYTRIAPPLTVIAATVPLLVVYVIFFVSQWQYYISGFTGVLPEAFSYASYAREGFFQLCAVSVINLLIILAALLFTRRKDGRPSWVLRVLAPLYSLSTLILIATAVAKMVMYIDTYGLTQKRVYATWFMAVLAIIFLLIAVWQFVPRFKAVFVAAAVCVVMFSGLALCNVNGLIASYNVDRALSGNIMSADVESLEDLGDAAVPSLVRLYQAHHEQGFTSGPQYRRLEETLDRAAERLEGANGVWSFTLPRYQAKQALEEIGKL